MSCVPPRRITLPADREEWREKRDARRQLLEKVWARRRLAMQRREERRRNC